MISRATVGVAVLLAIASSAFAQVTPPKPSTAPGSSKVAAPSTLPNYTELKYPNLRPIETPAVQTFTLANGMQLLLLAES